MIERAASASVEQSVGALRQKDFESRCAWTGVTLTTKCLNTYFLRLGRRFARPLRLWFDFGCIIGLVLTVTSSVFLLHSNFSKLWYLGDIFTEGPVTHGSEGDRGIENGSYTAIQDEFKFEVVPLLPGVTIPLNHFFYIWMAATISLVVHELGHALAATSQDVRVESAGAHIMFVPPIAAAFVNVARQDDHATLTRGRLRIYYAGVWHNVILCLGIYLAWHIVSAMYAAACVDHGALMVSRVHPRSVITGNIFRGDTLEAFNGEVIEFAQDFVSYVEDIAEHRDRQPGFCIPTRDHSRRSKAMKDEAASIAELDCCLSDSEDTDRQCFTSHRPGLTPFWFGNSSIQSKTFLSGFVCASFQDLRGLALRMCHMHDGELHNHECPVNHECVFPVLHTHDIMGRLSSRHLMSSLVARPRYTLYIGPPKELLGSLRFVKNAPAPWLRGMLRKLPYRIARWIALELPLTIMPNSCSYLISVSAGVAFLNALPIWGFDGAHVMSVVLVVLPFVGGKRPERSILDTQPTRTVILTKVRTWILHLGTCAFVINTVATAMVAFLG